MSAGNAQMLMDHYHEGEVLGAAESYARAGQRIRFTGYSLLGLLSRFVILGFAVRWAIGGFLRFTFIQLPSFKELMDSMVWNFSGSRKQLPFVLLQC